MNILKFLDALETPSKDTEEYSNLADRRDAVRKMSKWSRNLALAALPLSATKVFANAKVSSSDVTDVLNFALTLEYLENEFYATGLSQSGLIDSADKTIFQTIGMHENAHVNFLKDTISALGGSPVSKPNFDFTAGGNFDPFNDYAQFLALSQAFEDTGVRAYKGQAGNVMGNDTVLQAALQIHSVEARHAAEVRRLRTKKGMSNDKGWITGDSNGTLPSATQPIYNGEDKVTHLGIDITSITSLSTDAITEAWDEPLSKQDVLNIASLFIS